MSRLINRKKEITLNVNALLCEPTPAPLTFKIPFPIWFTASSRPDAVKEYLEKPSDLLKDKAKASSFLNTVLGKHEAPLLETPYFKNCHFCKKQAHCLEKVAFMAHGPAGVTFQWTPIPYCSRYSACENAAGKLGRMFSQVIREQPDWNNSDDSDTTHLKHGCRKCSAVIDVNKQCSGCKATTYCSKGCQLADWPAHKSVCRKVKKLKEEDNKLKEEARKATSAGS